jgi:hypothetical protein
LKNEEIAFLSDAQKRFTDHRIEALYLPFLHGQITTNAVSEQFRKLAPKREVSFRPELVDGQATLFEPNLAPRSSHQTETRVTGCSGATFGRAFNGAFGAEAQQAQEK